MIVHFDDSLKTSMITASQAASSALKFDQLTEDVQYTIVEAAREIYITLDQVSDSSLYQSLEIFEEEYKSDQMHFRAVSYKAFIALACVSLVAICVSLVASLLTLVVVQKGLFGDISLLSAAIGTTAGAFAAYSRRTPSDG